MFIATLESVAAVREFMDDFSSWMHDHPMFFGCSGMITWAALIIWAICWLVLHVRFV